MFNLLFALGFLYLFFTFFAIFNLTLFVGKSVLFVSSIITTKVHYLMACAKKMRAMKKRKAILFLWNGALRKKQRNEDKQN